MITGRTRTVAAAVGVAAVGALMSIVHPAQASAGIAAGVNAKGDFVSTAPRATFSLWVTGTLTAERTADLQFDVRVSRSPMTAPQPSAWDYPTALQGLPQLSSISADGPVEFARVTLPVRRGEALCVSTRVLDGVGELSAWSARSCVVGYLDDAELRRRGPVKRLRDRNYWGGRATALEAGGRLTLSHVPAGSIVMALASEETRRSGRGYVLVRVQGARREVEVCAVGRSADRSRHFSVASMCPTSLRPGPVRLVTRGPLSAAVEGLAVLPRWTWPRGLQAPIR